MMKHHKKKVVATIEARMTSSRLPGKVLLPVLGEPILMHLVRRLKAVPSIDAIVVATTINSSDDPIVEFAKEADVLCFRGSEDDVLARVIGAGELAHAEVLVEITGDCPIIDPDLVEQTIRMFLNHSVQYASNSVVRSYPDGMDTQVINFESLKSSALMTNDPLDREHVSRFIWKNPDIFSCVQLIAPPSLHWPGLGLTLDEESDYLLLMKIIEALSPDNPLFSCQDVINFLRACPNLLEINKAVVRKGDS
jgi:spore coat polysaccharide biosynthesis protein SpsF|tara:strand:- start:8385 stop:9137 length:753 start_codon:yes stop_codon:yes gene_type:complete